MKKHLFIGLVLTSLVLTGCGNLKNGDAIHSISLYQDSAIDITAKDVEYMIRNKYSFHLLEYIEDCNHCVRAKENAEKLIKETGFAIYKTEMFEASIEYLSMNFSNYFSKNDSYPSLITFNSGYLTSKSTAYDLTDYSSFKRLVNANSYGTNIHTLSSKEAYLSYKENHDNYLFYTYSYSNENVQDIFGSQIFSYASESNKNTLIVDISAANSDLIAEIRSDYSLSESEIIDLLVINENGQIKSSLRYSQESTFDIDDLLVSFFNSDSI